MSDGIVFETVNVCIDVDVSDDGNAEEIVTNALLADDRIKAVTLKTSELIIYR